MSKVIDQFPTTPGPMVLVCTGVDDDTRRSFACPINTRPIPVLAADPANPNLQWFPAAKIQVQGRSIGRVAGSGPEVIVDDELPRAVFWLSKATPADGGVTPADVEWQVRCSSGCTSEVLGSGTVHLKDIGQNGIIAQASGWLGNGYELWMRVNSLAAGAQVMLLDIEIRASRFHGGPRELVKGSVSI